MQRSIGACSWIFGGLSDQAIARNLCDSGLDGVEYNPRPQLGAGYLRQMEADRAA